MSDSLNKETSQSARTSSEDVFKDESIDLQFKKYAITVKHTPCSDNEEELSSNQSVPCVTNEFITRNKFPSFKSKSKLKLPNSGAKHNNIKATEGIQLRLNI